MTILALMAALALAGAEADADTGTEIRADGEPRLGLRFQGGVLLPAAYTRVSEGTKNRAAVGGGDLGFAANLTAGYTLHPSFALEAGTGIGLTAGVEKALDTVAAEVVGFRLVRVPLTLGFRVGLPRQGLWALAGAGAYYSTVREQGGFTDPVSVTPLKDEERDVALGGYAGLAWDLAIGPATRVGLELRYVKTATSFENLAYNGDGLQFMGGLTYRFGVGAAARGAPISTSPSPDAVPSAGEPVPDFAAGSRWRFLARVGGYFPTGADLEGLGAGPEVELGVARSFDPHVAAELAVGGFGAKTPRDSDRLPRLIVVPLTLSLRGIAPLGSHFEASAYGGAGIYVINFERSAAQNDTGVTPGLHVGVGLAARIWGKGSIGFDARLSAARSNLGREPDPLAPADPLTVSGLRLGVALAVPL